jgi:hypothetical protein
MQLLQTSTIAVCNQSVAKAMRRQIAAFASPKAKKELQTSKKDQSVLWGCSTRSITGLEIKKKRAQTPTKTGF